MNARRLHPRVLCLAALLLSVLPSWGQVTISVTAFNSASWGIADATLGVTGYTIEDFEDTTLVSGLLIGWNTPAGNVTPSSTLPFTFNPATQDPNGGAFTTGVWDGANTVVNTRTNQSYVYTDVANWGDVLISFTSPASSVGFSLQQNDFDVTLVINGTSFGGLQALTGIAPNGGRYGYIRIDATSGSISTIELQNGRFAFNDGFVIDRLAFAAIPEPSTYAVLAGLLAFGFVLMRRRGH